MENLPTYHKNKKALKTDDEKYIEDIYEKLLKMFKKYIPNDSGTYSHDLEAYGKGLLNQFRGVFTRDQLKQLKMRTGDSLIVNTDTSRQKGEHWCALYKYKPNGYIFYDSFGRDYKVTMKRSLDHFNFVSNSDITDREQMMHETSCGERCLVFLYICENLGIKYAKLI